MRAAKGIPLIENMVRAVMIHEPVRVVDETERHLDMQTVVQMMHRRESRRDPRIDLHFVKMLHCTHSSGRKNVKVRPNATAKPTALTRMYSTR